MQQNYFSFFTNLLICYVRKYGQNCWVEEQILGSRAIFLELQEIIEVWHFRQTKKHPKNIFENVMVVPGIQPGHLFTRTTKRKGVSWLIHKFIVALLLWMKIIIAKSKEFNQIYFLPCVEIFFIDRFSAPQGLHFNYFSKLEFWGATHPLF